MVRDTVPAQRFSPNVVDGGMAKAAGRSPYLFAFANESAAAGAYPEADCVDRAFSVPGSI
jgi:hypothetical protein